MLRHNAVKDLVAMVDLHDQYPFSSFLKGSGLSRPFKGLRWMSFTRHSTRKSSRLFEDEKFRNMNKRISSYQIPSKTRIGHVHLKVSDLDRSMDFYCGLLGFELISEYKDQAVFISAGGYHHHIALNTWYSKGMPPAPVRSAGLFHTAILYPTRKDLAIIYKRLLDAQYPFTGAADHGVSEALYLDDPDKNGVELYWDRPIEEWPKTQEGGIDIYTRPLDLSNLLLELDS